jgi:hypothetical protein
LTLSANNLTNVRKPVSGFAPAPGAATTLEQGIVANSSYVYSTPRSIVLRLSADF